MYTVAKWMVDISSGMGGGMPADWTKAIIVPVYKGKGRRRECGRNRGINLFGILRKVYGKVMREGAMTYIRENQRRTRRLQNGKGMCGSDIFIQDGSGENISKRKKTLYAAFMDLENVYDKVDWLALWEVLKIYGVGGKLLSEI